MACSCDPQGTPTLRVGSQDVSATTVPSFWRIFSKYLREGDNGSLLVLKGILIT